MNTFQQALDSWLARDGNTQSGLAKSINRTQAAVNRYKMGERFPDGETARAIDRATGGAVPFQLWQDEFFKRSGMAA